MTFSDFMFVVCALLLGLTGGLLLFGHPIAAFGGFSLALLVGLGGLCGAYER